MPLFLVKYVWLNLKAVFNGELTTEEKEYIHCVKFIEATIESVPQIGLSFYIIHHHGWNDNPALQVLSLAGSILSMKFGMATRRAWKSEKRDSEEEPHTIMVLKAFLWNLIPITCFLITYFIMMTCSSTMLMVFISVFLVVTIISIFLSWKTKYVILTMNRFIFIVVIIMASMYSVQKLAFPEGIRNCKIPFSNYCNDQNCAPVMEMENSTKIGKLNQTSVSELQDKLDLMEKTQDSTEKNHILSNINSLLEDSGIDKIDFESIEEFEEQLDERVQEILNKVSIKDPFQNFLRQYFPDLVSDHPFVVLNWFIVLVFLLFLVVEQICGEKQQEFYRFIMLAN